LFEFFGVHDDTDTFIEWSITSEKSADSFNHCGKKHGLGLGCGVGERQEWFQK
jgi:hypothetical protein